MRDSHSCWHLVHCFQHPLQFGVTWLIRAPLQSIRVSVGNQMEICTIRNQPNDWRPASILISVGYSRSHFGRNPFLDGFKTDLKRWILKHFKQLGQCRKTNIINPKQPQTSEILSDVLRLPTKITIPRPPTIPSPAT